MSSRSAIACLLALSAAGCSRQAAPPPQGNAAARASPDEAPPSATAPQAGTVDRAHRGETIPHATLTALDGTPVAPPTGKSFLVNLWATWCAPCVAELPALDTAAAGIDALALNQGEEPAKVGPFLAARHLTHLRPLLDKEMAVSLGLNVNLPTTILYDATGKEIWRVTGGRDWSNAESRALIAEAR